MNEKNKRLSNNSDSLNNESRNIYYSDEEFHRLYEVSNGFTDDKDDNVSVLKKMIFQSETSNKKSMQRVRKNTIK